jgi:predicted nucleic acid-binding protein
MAGSFFDTNVIVYLASGDPAKADLAERAIARGGTISVQVLNEFSNVARRKMQLSWDETQTFLSTIRSLLSVVPLTVESHLQGLALAQRYSLTVYDAMIAASALQADCNTLWSEDMQDGIVLDGKLQVKNPFRVRVPPRRQRKESR